MARSSNEVVFRWRRFIRTRSLTRQLARAEEKELVGGCRCRPITANNRRFFFKCLFHPFYFPFLND